jgi:uncharacterized membrane protein
MISVRPASVLPPSQKNKHLQIIPLALSMLSAAFILAASAYLTAKARDVLDVLNLRENSALVSHAELGSVFLGLSWGMVGAALLNVGILAAYFWPRRRTLARD